MEPTKIGRRALYGKLQERYPKLFPMEKGVHFLPLAIGIKEMIAKDMGLDEEQVVVLDKVLKLHISKLRYQTALAKEKYRYGLDGKPCQVTYYGHKVFSRFRLFRALPENAGKWMPYDDFKIEYKARGKRILAEKRAAEKKTVEYKARPGGKRTTLEGLAAKAVGKVTVKKKRTIVLPT